MEQPYPEPKKLKTTGMEPKKTKKTIFWKPSFIKPKHGFQKICSFVFFLVPSHVFFVLLVRGMVFAWFSEQPSQTPCVLHGFLGRPFKNLVFYIVF